MFDVNNLQKPSNITAFDLENSINKIKQDNGFKGLYPAFLDAENKYKVNAVILASIACLESGYATSKLAKEKNNLFGLDAPVSLQGSSKYGSGYKDKKSCIDYAANRIGNQYLELDNSCKWRYCNGNKDIYSIGSKWCEVDGWADKVISIANRISSNIKKDGGIMRTNWHGGHNPDGKTACGAMGIVKESTENRKVAQECIRLTKESGDIAYDCTVDNGTSVSDVINKIVAKCNAHTVDLDISIHFNSGAGDSKGNGKTTGVEVLVYSLGGKAEQAAKRICDRVSKGLGIKNRGVKVRTDLGYLKKTKADAILVECCFVDDKDDIDKYNYKAMAKYIVEGVLNKSINTPVPPSKPVSGDIFYRAVSGSFKGKENALERKAKLEKDKFTGVFLDAFVKDESTWYRVVAGSFKDKSLAEKRVNELKLKGYDGGFVTAFRK